MGRYKTLVKNSGIFAVANIGSHLISFFFVRFYTELLTKEEYGIIDLLTTTVSIIIPIVTLAIVEAVLRFSMDAGDRKHVFTNGIFLALCGTAFYAIFGSVVFSLTAYREYFLYTLVLVFLMSVDNICAQNARGSGQVTVFAISGIIKTAFLAGSNILFLLGLGMKTDGYLLALIVSETFTTAYLLTASKSYRELTIHVDRQLLGKMTRYSVPLIPNTLSWWIMNAADKYVILLMLGTTYNGLYAVAHKVPTLINMCNTLFFQAWQISAVEESNSKDKAQFYSNVFSALSFALMMLGALLFVFLKPVFSILSSAEFYEAWQYSPFLILGMIFAAFSSFLGTNYVAVKNTRGSLKTTVAGAGVNLGLNFVLIRFMGLSGAAIATMIGYIITWLFRVADTRKFVRISYDKWRLGTSLSILILQAALLSGGWDYASYSGLVIAVLILGLHYQQVRKAWNVGCALIKKRKG